MADEPVVERGVLTTPDQVWDAAVRQAEVIGRLAGKGTVGLEDDLFGHDPPGEHGEDRGQLGPDQ